jgi:hypothetical protein
MPPVRRPRECKGKTGENDISISKEKRIPLTEEMKIFLKKSPLILVPNLKLNIKEIPKASLYGNEKREKAKAEAKKLLNRGNEIKNLPPLVPKKSALKADRENVVSSKKAESKLTENRVIAKKATQEVEPEDEPVADPGTSSVDDSSPGNLKKSTSKPMGTPTKQKDIRDDDSKKPTFLSALDLVQKTTANRVLSLKETELPSALQQKLRARRAQVVSFFKTNPLPVSSTLGRKIIRSGLGKCPNPADEVIRYDKMCSGNKHRNPNGNTVEWPLVNVRRSKLKPGQYCHKYSFGTRQRITRQVELAVGVNVESFPLLNKCKDFTIHLYKMTDQDVAQAMFSLQNPAPKTDDQDFRDDCPSKKRKKEPRVWYASEPTAGPSRDIERIAEPWIEVEDIYYDPEYRKYFHRGY